MIVGPTIDSIQLVREDLLRMSRPNQLKELSGVPHMTDSICRPSNQPTLSTLERL